VDLGSLGSGAEAGTLTIDGNGRMWVAWDGTTDFRVRWSDFPYSSWSSTIIVASGANSDDICAIVALPGKIGLFWSDQTSKRFGFKTHPNGTDPSVWSSNEVPGSQSALNLGAGMADDHMNLVCASDGTLYCAVKTGYDVPGKTLLGLLVRRPSGIWDNIYSVSSNDGTRPQLVLNETIGKLKVIYTTRSNPKGGEDIMYRESSISNISFSRPYTLIGGDLAQFYNYTTTTHQIYSTELAMLSDDLVNDKATGILATDGSNPLSISSLTSTPVAGLLDDQSGLGKNLELNAFPNPFESNLTVSFCIPHEEAYTIVLYNSAGSSVAVINKGRAEAGKRNIFTVNGSGFASGLYFLKLHTDTGDKIIRLVLQK
jgi:hypothetical protein